MSPIPRSTTLDDTIAFRSDPYLFISRKCRELGSDVFETRLQLRRTLCMSGPLAARVFYDDQRFLRAGAAPEPVRATLFGKGGVQGLDGPPQRHRKAMFMSLMTPSSIGKLVESAHLELLLQAERWKRGERVSLYDAAVEALARAVCRWAGVPIEEPGFQQRVIELSMLFEDAANSFGGHLRTRRARGHSERWAAGLIRSVRLERLKVPEGFALHTIANHRDHAGKLLPLRVAAVELLNLLRPTVAVAVFIVHAAHALHEHIMLARSVADGDDELVERFVLEVRRYYPFFPAVAARVAADFEWSGYRFPHGQRVLLDLYGTNHDERTWHDPEAFDPDRFKTWDRSPYNFIAQGGGDFFGGHRCPGEWFTIELMKMGVRFLTRELRYEVPQQDLRIDFGHLPALPVDRFQIRNVSLKRLAAVNS